MNAPAPHPLGDETRHYWLAKRMAKCTGADLQAALEAGEISHSDWSDLVTRCRGCDWVAGCEAWMDRQDPNASHVPQACPNAETFERIIARQAGG